jgi:hypothetical protein
MADGEHIKVGVYDVSHGAMGEITYTQDDNLEDLFFEYAMPYVTGHTKFMDA